MWGEQLDVKLI